jgi:phosphoglycolate phosphatase-like HAD superfamily hydrolase
MTFAISSQTTILMDCDGVLLDSNHAKVSAMKICLTNLGFASGFVEWACSDFRANFGRTRAEHFQSFSENGSSFGVNFSAAKRELAMAAYSDAVKSIYQNIPTVPETLNFVCANNLAETMFVVSASEQAELRSLLPKYYSKLAKEKIYGGPVSKLENISHIKGCSDGSKSFLLIGDSVADARASLQSGIDFIGLLKYSADPAGLADYCRERNLPYFETMDGIKYG